MAREFRTYQVSIAAGTTSANPQTTALTMPSRIVRDVRIRVPRGPSGLMGFRLASGGVQVIPWASGSWIIMDDEWDDFPVEGQIDTGAWQLQGYNTGRYAHTVYLRFALDPVQAAVPDLPTGPPETIPHGSGDGGGTTPPPPDDGGGDTTPPPDDGGGDTTPPPDDTPPPDPGDVTTYADGYAAGKLAAWVSVSLALGSTPTATAPTRPADGTAARTGWDAAVSAAASALVGVVPESVEPPPPASDGAAIARRNALAAVRLAFGVTGGPGPVPAPLPSDAGRAAYDAAKATAVAAVRGILSS